MILCSIKQRHEEILTKTSNNQHTIDSWLVLTHKTAVLAPLMSNVNVFDIVVPHANNCIDIIVMQIQMPWKSIHISFLSSEQISQEGQDHEEIVFKQNSIRAWFMHLSIPFILL